MFLSPTMGHWPTQLMNHIKGLCKCRLRTADFIHVLMEMIVTAVGLRPPTSLEESFVPYHKGSYRSMDVL